jgi:hypothetical protein
MSSFVHRDSLDWLFSPFSPIYIQKYQKTTKNCQEWFAQSVLCTVKMIAQNCSFGKNLIFPQNNLECSKNASLKSTLSGLA